VNRKFAGAECPSPPLSAFAGLTVGLEIFITLKLIGPYAVVSEEATPVFFNATSSWKMPFEYAMLEFDDCMFEDMSTIDEVNAALPLRSENPDIRLLLYEIARTAYSVSNISLKPVASSVDLIPSGAKTSWIAPLSSSDVFVLPVEY